MQSKIFFDGDNTGSAMYNLQFDFYIYAISLIYSETKDIYLNNDYSKLYLTKDEIISFPKLETYDHRLLQNPHDYFAAAFRYKLNIEGIQIEIPVNPTVEPKSYFNSLFVDIELLKKADKKDWDVLVMWCEFIKNQLRSKLPITGCIARSLLFSDNMKEAFKESYLAAHLIKQSFGEIKWRI